MRTRDKVLLTILLAALCWFLFGCEKTQPCAYLGREHFVTAPLSESSETDLPYLRHLYKTYNEDYFHNHLQKDTKIDMDEEKYMATTDCKSWGVGCRISFNLKYTRAHRVADFTMLHEMCHMKAWMKEMDGFGQQVEHGKVWRGCMLQLDAEGAFREIIIDNYREDMPTGVRPTKGIALILSQIRQD
jgi:SprT-like family protein